MNDKQQGLLREFLAAVSAAAMAYGFGSESLWLEVSGGIVAAVVLLWGIVHNQGAEAWFSLIRKVFSSVAGVLVITGSLAPDKAQALLGAVVAALTMAWSVWGKDNQAPPPASLLAILAAFLILPSCAMPFPAVSITTPWGSGSKDALGNVAFDTPYASGSKSGLTGGIEVVAKAPFAIIVEK